MPTQGALRRFLQAEDLSCLIDSKTEPKYLPLANTFVICLPHSKVLPDEIAQKIHTLKQIWKKELILYWLKLSDTSKQYDALRITFIDERPGETRLHHGTLYDCALSLLDDFSQYEPEFQKRYQTWLSENNLVRITIKNLLEIPRIHPYLYTLEHTLTVGNMLVYTKLPKQQIPLFDIMRSLTLAYLLYQQEFMMLLVFTACWSINKLLSCCFSAQGGQQLLLYYLSIIAPLIFKPLLAIWKLEANTRDVMAVRHTADGAEKIFAATLSFTAQLAYFGLVFCIFSLLPRKIQKNPHHQAGIQSLATLTAPYAVSLAANRILPRLAPSLPLWMFRRLSSTTDEHGLNTLKMLCNPKTDCQLRIDSSICSRTLSRFYAKQTTTVSMKTPTTSATCNMKSSSNKNCRVYNLSCKLLFFPRVNTSDLAAIPEQDPVQGFSYFEYC